MKIETQIIITSGSASSLNQKIADKMKEGYVPVGSHTVAQEHAQNRYSGSQHMDTQYRVEYAQTMVKYSKPDDVGHLTPAN